MAKPRKQGNRWEICLAHPDLPKGRKYFSFETEAEAVTYEERWRAMRKAGLPLPAELLAPAQALPMMGVVLRGYANSGQLAPTGMPNMRALMREVGGVELGAVTYDWLQGYVRDQKVLNNLAPSTIRQRVQMMGRAIDEWRRRHPSIQVDNPIRLLPAGYSQYSEADTKLAQASGGRARVDVVRDRRLAPGEEDQIRRVLGGWRRPDRERGLELRGGDALLVMFDLIVNTGLRLREAYTLRVHQLDFSARLIRVNTSKQRQGRTAVREVPMVPRVHASLQQWLRDSGPRLPGAYVFPFLDEDDGLSLALCSSRLSARFSSAFAYAGCEGLVEHDLRHEATCRWLEMRDARGQWVFRLEELNRIMGWAPGSLMSQRYASFRPSDLADRVWAAHGVEHAG